MTDPERFLAYVIIASACVIYFMIKERKHNREETRLMEEQDLIENALRGEK